MSTQKERPTVELVDPRYQPSKAEKEEEVTLPNTEDKTPQDMARALMRTVDVRYVRKKTP